jgi:cytidylate kinase
MNNTLMAYLNKRLHPNDTRYPEANSQPGPVISISREVGCGAGNIANLLAIEFDKQSQVKKWKVLSKDILQKSAVDLNMDPYKLRQHLTEGERNLFDDILSAFTEKRHISEKMINQTLIGLVSSVANDGYCIIVGLAGHIISRHIEKSLHVKLTADHDWRVKQIMEKNKLNIRQAIEFIEKTEQERLNFRKRFVQENETPDVFDLTINLSRISTNETVKIIQSAAQIKGLLEYHKSKVEVF